MLIAVLLITILVSLAIGVPIVPGVLALSIFSGECLGVDSLFPRRNIPLGLHAESRPQNSIKHRLRAIFLSIK